MTDEERRKLVSWWIFYQLDYLKPDTPDDIMQYIKYVEEWPHCCDSVLRQEYTEYRNDPVCLD